MIIKNHISEVGPSEVGISVELSVGITVGRSVGSGGM